MWLSLCVHFTGLYGSAEIVIVQCFNCDSLDMWQICGRLLMLKPPLPPCPLSSTFSFTSPSPLPVDVLYGWPLSHWWNKQGNHSSFFIVVSLQQRLQTLWIYYLTWSKTPLHMLCACKVLDWSVYVFMSVQFVLQLVASLWSLWPLRAVCCS